MPATRPYIPRILLAFDFDGTLATDSLDAVLELYGTDRATWEREHEKPLGQGWDQIMRRGQALIHLGRARDEPFSIAQMRRAAERVRLFDGVLDMPDRLTRVAREVHPETELEFVVISSGFAEIINASSIAGIVQRTFGSTFHYDADGLAVCMKRIIGHPEKALYLDAVAKDLDVDGANAPETAGPEIDEHDHYVPLDQMIYAGDGLSDLHAFGFMRRNGGLAIAIDKNAEFDHADRQLPTQRVDNLAGPDYSLGGELMQSLEHAVRAAAARIALRALGHGE